MSVASGSELELWIPRLRACKAGSEESDGPSRLLHHNEVANGLKILDCFTQTTRCDSSDYRKYAEDMHISLIKTRCMR